MQIKTIKKAAPKEEKLKTEIKQIKADLKKLKKSKRRMQFLWYRTKREHVALIKDLDIRLKALKKELGKNPAGIKRSKKPQNQKPRVNKK
jgi:hypothetical protein